MGRPTKLTPEVQQQIADAIRAGLTYKLAAQVAGIHYDTLRQWLIAGAQEDAPEEYIAFSEAVRAAEAEGALANLTYIAASPDWRARAWIIEHRYPEDYGTKSVLTLTGDAERPIQVHTVTFLQPPPAPDEAPPGEE